MDHKRLLRKKKCAIKRQKNHTVWTVPKSNRQVIERGNIDTEFFLYCFVHHCLSVSYCICCASSNYCLWLSLWYLQTLLAYFFIICSLVLLKHVWTYLPILCQLFDNCHFTKRGGSGLYQTREVTGHALC